MINSSRPNVLEGIRWAWCLPLLVFVYVLVAVHYGLTCLYNFQSSYVKDELFYAEIKQDYGVDIQQLPYIAALFMVSYVKFVAGYLYKPLRLKSESITLLWRKKFLSINRTNIATRFKEV